MLSFLPPFLPVLLFLGLLLGSASSLVGQEAVDGGERRKQETASPGSKALAERQWHPAFEDFDDQQDRPSEETLKKLLAPVPGQGGQIQGERNHPSRACRISGLFRLNLPWEAGSTLQCSFLEPRELRLHFWDGPQGVSLVYYSGFHSTWAVYATTREANEPKPVESALWATDGGRYRRCGPGTLQLHWHEGYLVLTRGDVRLFGVPFARLPAEVYVECGESRVRGLAMVRSPDVPPAPASRPACFQAEKPAELEWTCEPPEGARFNKLPDGRVELSADEKAAAVQAGTRVAKPGLYEFVFLVEDPEPGAGVYLGDDEGKQRCRLGFFRWSRSKPQVLFGPLHPHSADFDRSVNERHQPAPLAGPRQFFRLTVGAGTVKYWTSGDGIHWSQVIPSAETLEGVCTHVGLYACQVRQKRAIKLARIEVRRFDALMSLAPEAIQDRVDVGPLVKADSEQVWEQRVAESQPQEVPFDVWWRACAVRTLSENPRLPLGQAILDRLQAAALAEPGDLRWQLQLLGEAALLTHPQADRAAQRLAERYERLGLLLARQGYHAPFTLTLRALMRSPLWTESRLTVVSDRLLRHELFLKLGDDRFDDVETLCRQARYWNRSGSREGGQSVWSDQARHLVHWAESQATGRIPAEAGQATVGPSPWRHPLLVSPTREGYNIFGEFAAALEGQTYREACQILASAAQTEGLGLLPDRDRRLWVSLPVAVELAMREHPPLRQAMQEGFGPLGDLRFKRAAAQGDEAAVAAVALQFFGTTAARDAHRWLGDRALAAGRFAEAMGRYRQALAMESGAETDALRARQRLAASLLGRDVGAPPNQPVVIGSRQFTAEQFEQLVGQLRRTRQPALAEPGPAEAEAARPEACFAPGACRAASWAVVESPQVRKPGPLPDRELDWFGRQVGVALDRRQMFVTTQVDQMAFDLATGRQDWVQRGPAVDPQWPLVPMRPATAWGRVFVRRLAEVNPELACLGSADGRLLWSCKPDTYVASDPLVLGGRLFVLTVGEDAGEKLILNLAGIDADTGRVRSRQPLAGFHDLWQRRLSFQVAVVDDRIVVVGGGGMLCCDASGNLHWVRRQIWTPVPRNDFSVARPWYEQCCEPPLVAEGRVYATQPGSWCVECIELASGRLVWRQAVPELTRLAGLVRGRLVAETADGLAALEAASGKPLWFRAADAPQHARPCVPDDTLVYVRAVKQEGDRRQFELVWLTAETGTFREKTVLEIPAESVPFLGPLVGEHGRQWAVFGTAGQPTKRVLLELTPAAAGR